MRFIEFRMNCLCLGLCFNFGDGSKQPKKISTDNDDDKLIIRRSLLSFACAHNAINLKTQKGKK